MPKRSSLALDSIIRRRIETSKRGTGLGIPSDRDGRDGTVKVFRTKDGVSLFGKIGRKWYKFASGSKVGPSGKHNPKEIGGDENLGNLNLTGILKLKSAKFTVNERDYLQIDSNVFDVTTSNTVSKLSIGDISLQPTWGTTGADITLEGAANNSSSHITIQGGSSTGGNNNGGNIYIAAGGGAGAGADGVIGLGHSGAATGGSYVDIWPHIRLRADKKLYFDGVEDTTGMLDTAGNTYIYADSDDTDILDFKVGNVTMLKLDETNDKIQFKGGAIELLDTTDAADLFRITVAASGVTTFRTVDDGATVGHLYLVPDGDLVLDPASQNTIINATDKLYFDGGGDTYIHESAADAMRHVVGGDILFEMFEHGDDGNNTYFRDSCVTFQQLEPTYNATNTEVDFRFSNKQFLTFGGGNITNMKITFPNNSGNFVLLLKQDGTGSRTVTNWKAMEFDESSADGSAAVKWAGGSAPTLTTDANHVDILSFYWDGDNEIAYGVASLDFQF